MTGPTGGDAIDDPLGAFVGPTGVLVAGAADAPPGPLVGSRLGVKDLFDVAGTVTRAGNPAFAEGRAPAERSAPAVDRLVAAGASVVGRTVTDELAFSLSGTNVHDGTPTNPAAPGHVPGGSSAGSAAAVAGGLVDLALGTDTAGSIRVPASYCGILGWRPSHGAVPIEGVVPLAPSFDTVGLFARDGRVLAAGAAALLGATDDADSDDPKARELAGPVRVVAETFDEARGGVDAEVAQVLRANELLADAPVVEVGVDLETALAAQRTRQAREAWLAHGEWLTARRPPMGPGIAGRFEMASGVTDADVAAQAEVAARVRTRLHELLAEGPLVVPAAAGPPPPVTGTAAADRRAATLRLTCLAGLAGAPVVVVPAGTIDGLPIGLAVIGPPGSDLALIRRFATDHLRPRQDETDAAA